MKGSTNTFPAGGDVHVSTQCLVIPYWGLPRRHTRERLRKQIGISKWRRAPYRRTAVQSVLAYGYFSSFWWFTNRVTQKHGGETPSDDRLGDDGDLRGTIICVLCSKTLRVVYPIHQKYSRCLLVYGSIVHWAPWTENTKFREPEEIALEQINRFLLRNLWEKGDGNESE